MIKETESGGAPPGAEAPVEIPERWSAPRKTEVVPRLLRGEPLDAVVRDLSGERYAVLYLDGFHLKVPLARRVVAVPVLAALGVTKTGQKRLVALQVVVSEAATSSSGLLTDLQRRGLRTPRLAVTDGHLGLKRALDAWPTVRVLCCTTRRRRNLNDACPIHVRPELHRDHHRVLHAAGGLAPASVILRGWL